MSLRFVENPARIKLSRQTSFGNVLTMAVSIVILSAFSLIILKSNFKNRVPENIELIAREGIDVKPNRKKCFSSTGTTSPGCIYGGENVKVVLLGDSHGDAMTTAVAAAMPDKSDGVLDLTYASCPTIYSAKTIPSPSSAGRDCFEFNKWERNKISGIDKKNQ